MMPASQGVLPWPAEGPYPVALAEEGELPLDDYSVDRVLLIHAVEFSEQSAAPQGGLARAGRRRAGAGRRAEPPGHRARVDRTPFGQGQPYTPGQLSRLLREEGFTPLTTTAALFVPPARSRMILRSAAAWEKIGERWFAAFAGVSIVEATKQSMRNPWWRSAG